MSREIHVGFCEQLRGRFPRLTLLVVGFQHKADARRFQTALRERLEEFSLTLHPDKTRLIEFGRFATQHRALRGLGKPETFDFFRFYSHLWPYPRGQVLASA